MALVGLYKKRMSVYNHRPMVPAPQTRLVELLDAVRSEMEQLTQELYVAKNQRDDFEHKSKIEEYIYIKSFFYINPLCCIL